VYSGIVTIFSQAHANETNMTMARNPALPEPWPETVRLQHRLDPAVETLRCPAMVCL
jgi:hypothetical protein